MTHKSTSHTCGHTARILSNLIYLWKYEQTNESTLSQLSFFILTVCCWQHNHYVFVMDCLSCHLIALKPNLIKKNMPTEKVLPRMNGTESERTGSLFMFNQLRKPHWNRFIAHVINPKRLSQSVATVSAAQFDNVSVMRWIAQVT